MEEYTHAKEFEFNKNKLIDVEKWSERAITDIKVESGKEADDFIKDLITFRVTRYFYTYSQKEQSINVYSDRPRFLDWLLRRRKKHTFKLTPKDVLIDPPKGIKTERIYLYEKV